MPRRDGIVAAVSGCFAAADANILVSDQRSTEVEGSTSTPRSCRASSAPTRTGGRATPACYGGTSLGAPEWITAVARRVVETADDGRRVVLFIPTALAADDPNGFVRNRVSIDQTLTDLVDGSFYEEVRCRQRCKVTTQIGIGPAAAARLGFPNVKAGQYYVVGQVTRTLPAGTWTKIKLPLFPDAQQRLATSTTGVKIAGRLVARSTTSGRNGWASWFRTCELPAG